MSKWFVKLRYTHAAKMRVFLFPFAGGGPSIYRGWQASFDQRVDLFAIHAPGREGRYIEEPISCLDQMVEKLQSEIWPFLDKPHVFVGHSNGSIVALELARSLAKQGNQKLVHMVISAKRAPHLPHTKAPTYNLPYEEFVADLRKNSAIPDTILNDREMLDIFIPMLRADYALGIGYDFSDPLRLGCDASLFWGANDDDVPKEDMLAWDRYFTGKISFKEFFGDHFFINSHSEKYILELNELVRGHL